MKKEYDFSKAEKAKFYIEPNDIKVPVYLDKTVNGFYLKAAHIKNTDLSTIINSVLKKEIEILHKIRNDRN